jgi:hypothetical protein
VLFAYAAAALTVAKDIERASVTSVNGSRAERGVVNADLGELALHNDQVRVRTFI